MKSYMLIDCGATNCNVQILFNDSIEKQVLPGFSPISQEINKIPIPKTSRQISHIVFFGTAMDKTFWAQAQKIYELEFPTADIQFANDLVAAAKATSGDKEAYIHILGTGSASAFWDGKNIIRHKKNLGYLFEDYASGYDIAREIIKSWNEGLFSEDEVKRLEHKNTLDDLIFKIYQSKNPKSELSKLSYLINELSDKSRMQIFNSRLEHFFTKNIDNFELQIPHNFIGSMAKLMEPLIREKAKKRGIIVGEIMKNSNEGLINYYQQKIANQNGK